MAICSLNRVALNQPVIQRTLLKIVPNKTLAPVLGVLTCSRGFPPQFPAAPRFHVRFLHE